MGIERYECDNCGMFYQLTRMDKWKIGQEPCFTELGHILCRNCYEGKHLEKENGKI